MANNRKLHDALMTIMESLLEVNNLEDALNTALETLVKALRGGEGVIWVPDQNKDQLYPLVFVGPADISSISIEGASGIEGKVMQTGESTVISDTSSDLRFDISIFDENGMPVHSMICVPLKTGNKVAGCIEVVNHAEDSPFDQEGVRLCERMAALTALLLEENDFQYDGGIRKEVLISLRNVIKEFPSGEGVNRVLKGINLDIYKGEFLVILGESGCGKSTLVNIIGGMDFLTDGELIIDGKDFSHPTDKQMTKFRREYMGFVFQSYNLLPNLNAVENIRYIAEIGKNPMKAEEALALVDLSDRARNFPSALSGGQQQRVSIARAIVKNPQIIFADEPTAALDYSTSIEVLCASLRRSLKQRVRRLL